MIITLKNICRVLVATVFVFNAAAAQPVHIPDLNLRARIEAALGIASGDAVTQAEMAALISLDADNANISNLTGLEFATDLKVLILSGNNIGDISALRGLVKLEAVYLGWNRIADISPLVSNTELKDGDSVDVRENPLSYTSINTHIPMLRSRGAAVEFTNRTPVEIRLVSADDVRGLPGTELEGRFLVEVLDETWVTFEGVPVTFTVTAGGGTLNTGSTTTDADGRAETTLTLGPKPGTNTVSVSVTEIQEEYTINAEAFVKIPDPELRVAIHDSRRIPLGDGITLTDMKALEHLGVSGSNVSDLTGLEYATNLRTLNLAFNNITDISILSGLINLTWLNLHDNSIVDFSPLSGLMNLTLLSLRRSSKIDDISLLSGLTNLKSLSLTDTVISDISPLSGMVNLTDLNLADNAISDISPLSGLVNLTELYLADNAISDISPLVGLRGLAGDGSTVTLRDNPLNYAAIHMHIPALQDRDVEVRYDGRTPRYIRIVSGDNQQGLAGTVLENPFVVEVLDQRRVAYEGVPVTFTVAAGGGTLSTGSTTTDADGKAETTLTLGSGPGTNTVALSVAKIPSELNPSITAIAEPPPILGDVNRDGEVNILDLVSVASVIGSEGQDLPADVNSDGVVNILDLVAVAGAFGDAANPQ